MNLSFFGSPIDSINHEIGEAVEHAKLAVHAQPEDSLDEGGEYMDDELRMTDQAFKLD